LEFDRGFWEFLIWLEQGS